MSKIQRYGGDTMLFADYFGDIVMYDDHTAIVAQLEADLAEARKDQARYQFVYEWLEQKVQGTKEFFRAKTKEQYNVAIDAAIKEQGK